MTLNVKLKMWNLLMSLELYSYYWNEFILRYWIFLMHLSLSMTGKVAVRWNNPDSVYHLHGMGHQIVSSVLS